MNTRICYISDKDLQNFVNPDYVASELTLVWKNPSPSEKNKLVIFYESNSKLAFSSFEDGVNFERNRVEQVIKDSSLNSIFKNLLIKNLKEV